MNKSKNRGRTTAAILALLIFFSGCVGRERAAIPEDLSKRSPAAAFLASRVEESGGLIAGAEKDPKLSGHAYLYDNAVALFVLSSAGADRQAEKIADAMVFAQEHDRKFRDGRFRNAYVSGDLRADSGRSAASGRVSVRLPGFWQNGGWQEDSYTVSTSTGNMAWVILALCKVSERSEKREEYLRAAERAADFTMRFGLQSGGFAAGYEGWDESQRKLTYLSTEHNIDLIPAFSALADAVEERDPDRASAYRDAAERAARFVLSMYDEEHGCFYTGTEADGRTISKGVLPLDTNTLAVLALGDGNEAIRKTLAFVEEHMAVGDGFDFSSGDLDGIWNEGTAQMAVCYAVLGEKEKYEAVMSYLRTQTARDGGLPAADRDNVSTGFVSAGSEELWEYHNTESIGATGWLALAELKLNPFQKKNE